MSKGLATRVDVLVERLCEGGRSLPWEVQSGCSFRRIASVPTRENGLRYRDGNVLAPYRQTSDGHPDLNMPEEQLEALCELVNLAPQIAAALRARRV